MQVTGQRLARRKIADCLKRGDASCVTCPRVGLRPTGESMHCTPILGPVSVPGRVNLLKIFAGLCWCLWLHAFTTPSTASNWPQNVTSPVIGCYLGSWGSDSKSQGWINCVCGGWSFTNVSAGQLFRCTRVAAAAVVERCKPEKDASSYYS